METGEGTEWKWCGGGSQLISGEFGVSCVDFGEFGVFRVQIHADFGVWSFFLPLQPQGAAPGDAPRDKSKPWEAGS